MAVVAARVGKAKEVAWGAEAAVVVLEEKVRNEQHHHPNVLHHPGIVI